MEAFKPLCWVSVIAIMLVIERGEANLSNNFYTRTCPQVETIVKQAVAKKYNQTFVTPQATLRLFFHDCFVQGCDASVMIFSENSDAEKDSADDISIAGDGFDTIIKAKQAVEAVCPGVVSCADIMALAARDAVVIAGGPSFKVELGRRDGLRSKASDVPGNLPQTNFNLSQLVAMFSKHNLTKTDLIALSGAHTIGAAHCIKFTNRIYNFSSSNPVDPSLNPLDVQRLKTKCPPNVNPNVAVPMDILTPRKFDNVYFQNLVRGYGIFTSDQVLYTDLSSRPIVVRFANSVGQFNAAFTSAMIKLGKIGVKTGSQGEIRKNCDAFNSRN